MNETALELEFRIHYHESDKMSGPWHGTRIRSLCNLLNLTQSEFARYIRLQPHVLKRYISKGRFPGCVLLVLDLVERAAHSNYLGSVPKKSLFPITPNG